MRMFQIMVFLVVLSGCASSGPKFSGAVEPAPGKAIVYVYRPPAFTGSVRMQNIFLNDKLVVGLKNGTYTYLELEPGSYEFKSAIEKWAIEGKNARTPLIVSNNLVKGRTYYLVHYSSGFPWSDPSDTVFDRHSEQNIAKSGALGTPGAGALGGALGALIDIQNHFGFIRAEYAEKEIGKCGFIGRNVALLEEM